MVRSEIDAISAAYGISPEQVLEIEREVSETSDMLRDEMANAKKAAKDR